MSIHGTGIDRIAIKRIKHSAERFGEKFLQRIYTDAEYELAKKRGTYRRLAMFFAAKEAAAKAMGTGFTGFAFKDIEVVYLDSGKPEIRLHGPAKETALRLNIKQLHLSLTDDDGTAMAFVIAEY